MARIKKSSDSYTAYAKGGAKMKKMASGGKTSSLGMKSVKAGFDKNPGVTRADIIVAGQGKARGGKKIKKAQTGTITPKVSLRTGQLKRLGRLSAKNAPKAERVAERMVERRSRVARGKEYLQKNIKSFMPEVPTVGARKGTKVTAKKTMRGGGKMKNCRGGCY